MRGRFWQPCRRRPSSSLRSSTIGRPTFTPLYGIVSFPVEHCVSELGLNEMTSRQSRRRRVRQRCRGWRRRGVRLSGVVVWLRRRSRRGVRELVLSVAIRRWRASELRRSLRRLEVVLAGVARLVIVSVLHRRPRLMLLEGRGGEVGSKARRRVLVGVRVDWVRVHRLVRCRWRSRGVVGEGSGRCRVPRNRCERHRRQLDVVLRRWTPIAPVHLLPDHKRRFEVSLRPTTDDRATPG